MVGLPATGKSFTSRNLSRYLRWLGIESFIFSAARYRQDMLHGQQIKAEFFDASIPQCLEQRTQVADATLNGIVDWFKHEREAEGYNNNSNTMKVAIMDASNTIQLRRTIIKNTLKAINVPVIYIEFVYETEGLLNEHLPFLHLLCPDYEHLDSEVAQEDYKQRIKYYRERYEPVNDLDGSYMKLINGGQQVILNQINGFLPSKVLFYLMNLHFGVKKIFLKLYNPTQTKTTTPGDIIKNCKNIINSVDALDSKNLVTWTAPDLGIFGKELKRVEFKSLLSAINLANLENLSNEQISEIYPEEVIKNQQNPYKHRYPRCESYADLSRRLETVMMELERVKENVLIIADISVIRCIYSYFVETSNPDVINKILKNIIIIVIVIFIFIVIFYYLEYSFA